MYSTRPKVSWLVWQKCDYLNQQPVLTFAISGTVVGGVGEFGEIQAGKRRGYCKHPYCMFCLYLGKCENIKPAAPSGDCLSNVKPQRVYSLVVAPAPNLSPPTLLI